MPNFAAVSDLEPETPRNFATVRQSSNTQIEHAAALTRPGESGWFSSIAGSALLGLPDLIDTVASSIPGAGSIAGIERGQINNAMLKAIDMPGLTTFYNDHRDGIEIASGIYGIIGAELLTRKVSLAAAPLVAGLKTLPFARRIATLDKQYERAMETVRAVDTSLAQKGIIGADQYVASALVPVANWTKAGFTTSMELVGRGKIAQRAKGLGFAKGAFAAAKVEATMAATLNTNSFLYSDDVSQNMLWMSLGVVIPGAFSAQQTVHAMKKFVNSDLINRFRAEALDQTGMEASRLNPFDRSIDSQKVKDTYLGSLQGTTTDNVTALMVEAHAAPGAADASTVARMRTQREGLAFEEMEKVVGKGILGEGRATMKDRTVGDAIRNLLTRDPGGMMNVEMTGVIPKEKTAGIIHLETQSKIQERLDKITKQLDDDAKLDDGAKGKLSVKDRIDLFKERKQLRFMNQTIPGGIVDGERVSLSQLEVYDNWVEPEIKSSKFGDKMLFEATEVGPGAPTHNIAIDENLDMFLPKNRSIDKLDLFESLRLFRAGDKLVSHLAAKAGQSDKFKLVIPKNPNWFQLEIADELLRRTDGTATVIYPNGMTRENAQVEAFAQKVDAIRGQNLVDADDVHKARVMYNLPKLTSYEAGVLRTETTPIDILIRGAAAKGGGDAIRGTQLAELKKALQDTRRISDLAAQNATQVDSIRGTSFQFLQDSKGQPIAPLMTYSRPFKPHEWVKDNLAERLAIRKHQMIGALTDQAAGPITKTLTTSLLNSADLQLAAKVNSLADIQLQSALPGAVNMAPSSPVGSIVNDLTSAEWRARDNPILQAVTRLGESVDRMSLSFMKQEVEASMGDLLTQLNGPRSNSSRILMDNFHSFRPGWDLEEKLVEHTVNNEKLYGFVLEDTVANKAAFRRQFGREMGKGEMLMTPQGKPVVLDELAMSVQKSVNQLTDARRIEKNTILRAQGLPEIKRKSWYVPSPSVEGKFIGFTFDASDNIVPGGTIVASTQDEYNRILNKMRDDPDSAINKVGNIFRSREEIKEFADIWDRAQMEMIDAGTTATAGGKTNRGALTGAYSAARRFDDSMVHLRDDYLTHGRDVLTSLLKDQINAAKMRANLGAPATPNKIGGIQMGKPSTIHDYWLDAVYGRPAISSPGSPLGKIMNATESAVNSFLRSAAPTAAHGWHAMTDWIRDANPFGQTAQDIKTFDALTKKLGDFMPFKDAAELAERRGAGKMPLELSQITGGLNQFTAAWMLRMFESAHAVMNLTGIVNAMPSVVRHASMKTGETVEEFAQRIGHSADIFTTPSGRSVGVMNMGKLAQRGFQRSWSRVSDADYKRLADKGMLSQEVSEFKRAFNVVENRGAVSRFFGGDPSAGNAFARKGLTGWLSILSDKSEDFTRSWAHFIGDDLGRQLGIPVGDSLDNFAHDIANKMIANYNPANRPVVFQGAVGAPFGLFQSFIFNYFQRLFRYIETGDVKSIAVQYATQSTLFGAKSVPGFAEANDLFFQATNGETSPYDGVYAGFGMEAGDLLMNGTLSNIPKIFGAPGVDLYSRGDTAVRLPGYNAPPAFAVLKKIKEGVGQAIDLFSESNPHLTVQQIGEVVSNALPNRPLAGMTEVLLTGGQDTDGYGQLVSETKGWMDSAYRIMGLRGMQQSEEVNAYFSNKQAQEIAHQHRDILNRGTRAAIRAGDESALPKIYAQYIEQGGDPSDFRRWYKGALEAATKTRGTRMLEKAMKDPDQTAIIERLMDAGVDITDDVATEDPMAALTIADPMDNPMPTATEDDPGYAYGVGVEVQ